MLGVASVRQVSVCILCTQHILAFTLITVLVESRPSTFDRPVTDPLSTGLHLTAWCQSMGIVGSPLWTVTRGEGTRREERIKIRNKQEVRELGSGTSF